MVAGCFSATAESVSRKEAQKIAVEFFNEVNKRSVAQPKYVYNGKRLTHDRLFTPFYVFNNPSGGFVIIAADNKAYPILGFSLLDSFDPDNLGVGLKALLSGFARDVEYIRLDNQVPEEAIHAWQNPKEYISYILKEPFHSYEPKRTPGEVREIVHSLASSYDAESYSSDIYTPTQWNETIGEELKSNGFVALGFPTYKGFPTGTIYGQKGNFFRIDLDGQNNAFYRLGATEYFVSPQIAMTGKPMSLDIKEPIEEPFEFYDSFISEQKEAQNKARIKLEETENPSDPKVRFIGAGHFDIRFPEPIRAARIYNLAGALIETFKYGDRPEIHVDISAHPLGFYFMLAIGSDGKPYGIKLVR